MPLKFFGEQGGYTSDVIAAIEYAKSMNVDIINCSFGGFEKNMALRTAMEKSGILFVTATGNGDLNLDETPVYPACFELDNIIAVGSMNNNGAKADGASIGSDVDIYAPGINILSTIGSGQYEYGSGSSQAAAFVSSILGLAKSANQSLSSKEMIDSVLANQVH